MSLGDLHRTKGATGETLERAVQAISHAQQEGFNQR
jgi:hypothetical protein